MSAFVGVYVI